METRKAELAKKARSGGCAAKIWPGDLAEILKDLPRENHPDLIVGCEKSEDAGVYRLTDDLAIIQTLDFFPPIVNDPYNFGRIAAANALSDVYAMGGRPVTAMNIVCFPVKEMDKGIMRNILQGGLEKIHEAGAALAGGHSIDDPELKYGLSVTGIVAPDRILTNAKAQPGDRLILTKRIGTGILSTAVKAGMASSEAENLLIDAMATLNKNAAEVMALFPVNACTDVTGFGLLGHALEVAVASGVTISLDASRVPLLPEALDFAGMGLVPAGSYANRDFCSCRLRHAENIDPVLLDVLSDAQTSGGLFISAPARIADELLAALRANGVEYASAIGEVTSASNGLIELYSSL